MQRALFAIPESCARHYDAAHNSPPRPPRRALARFGVPRQEVRELVPVRAQGEPSPEATNFRAPISNFLEKTSREVEKKGVPRWDEGARKPRGNHAELD